MKKACSCRFYDVLHWLNNKNVCTKKKFKKICVGEKTQLIRKNQKFIYVYIYIYLILLCKSTKIVFGIQTTESSEMIIQNFAQV